MTGEQFYATRTEHGAPVRIKVGDEIGEVRGWSFDKVGELQTLRIWVRDAYVDVKASSIFLREGIWTYVEHAP